MTIWHLGFLGRKKMTIFHFEISVLKRLLSFFSFGSSRQGIKTMFEKRVGKKKNDNITFFYDLKIFDLCSGREKKMTIFMEKNDTMSTDCHFFSTTVILSFFFHDRNIVIVFFFHRWQYSSRAPLMEPYAFGTFEYIPTLGKKMTIFLSGRKKNDNIPLWSGRKKWQYSVILSFFSIAEMSYCHFFLFYWTLLYTHTHTHIYK